MSDHEIWISNIFQDSSIVRGTDIVHREPHWAAMRERQSVSEEELSLSLYADVKDEALDRLVDISIIILKVGSETKVGPLNAL